MKTSSRLNVTLLLAATAATFALAGCAALSIEDRDLGLSKAGVFETPRPAPFDLAAPGPVSIIAPLPGSGMPPMISHGVEEHLPITAKNNDCLECHDKPLNIGKPVAAGKAQPAPASHYVGAAGQLQLSGKQYNCIACHAPQAQVPALVKNASL